MSISELLISLAPSPHARARGAWRDRRGCREQLGQWATCTVRDPLAPPVRRSVARRAALIFYISILATYSSRLGGTYDC